MVGADTNLILRLFLEDDPAQVERVRALAKETDFFVPVTVILELEWVLRGVYKYSPHEISRMLTGLITNRSFIVESDRAVAAALATIGLGIDFADALHHALSTNCTWFATFDRSFVKRAASLSPPVRQP